jgi:hypothetical protein
MAADNVTPIRAGSKAGSPEPSRETTVAGFPDLYVWCRPCFWRPGYALVQYSGCAEDLVGAGILPRRALQIGRPRKAERRTDVDGDRWSVAAYFRMGPSGRRRRVYKVSCQKPMVHVQKLPGAAEALDADTRWCAWEEQRQRELEQVRAQYYEAGHKLVALGVDPDKPFLEAIRHLDRPALRLVVDNTREKGSPS